MARTIAIIDADICFTYLLISRLQKHLPGFLAFPVSGDVLKAHRNFVLDNEFVLYNQHEITKEEVLLHCINEPKPTLIPLLSTHPPYPPKDVLMLVHEVESRAGLGRIPKPRDASVQTCLTLSFIPPEERERHVRQQISRAMSDFKHVVRLDVMPGIRMPLDPPYMHTDQTVSTSGISALIDKLQHGKFSFQEIPSYLEPDPYGDLRFGRPIHSDDVFTCHARTLNILINRTVRYLSSLGETAVLDVVVDGLSFTRMRTLARALSHMEILTPLDFGKDYMLCHEIDLLQKEHVGTAHMNIPFSLKKLVS
ncbi:MAG: hypothetical protein KBT07_07450 [Clostridiales bacterium]|nr:hypothetical protein [Candidatus Scatonaster coprocaballi]